MKIIRLDKAHFEKWEDGISSLIRESVTCSFPCIKIDEGYYSEKCQEMKMYLEENKAIVFLAVTGNKLTGFIWCHKIQRFGVQRLHVAHLSVFQEWRGRGVGMRLEEAAVHYALEEKLKGIELFATASNSKAVGFYEKAGFGIERYLLMKELG